jgi:hypothetical protein
VQIDWVPKDKQEVPAIIQEDLDINGDSIVEIHAIVNTISGQVRLTRKVSWVLEAEPLVKADSEQILRIRLRNPRK